MGVSKIEQLIEDIYEFVESCKMQPLSSTKVIVPKDELYDLLDELRLRTPDEIKRYQKIIANRDAILSEAQQKANSMLADAEAQTNALVDEHQIMQQAYYQAQEVVNEATAQANQMLEQARSDADQIRLGALSYTNDLLLQAEKIVGQAYNSSKTQYDGLMQALQSSLDVISGNRSELVQNQKQSSGGAEPAEENDSDLDQNGDFQFDEDTFLNDIDQ